MACRYLQTYINNNWDGEEWIGGHIHIAAITSNGLESKIVPKRKRS
jgi:hypothetical protein